MIIGGIPNALFNHADPSYLLAMFIHVSGEGGPAFGNIFLLFWDVAIAILLRYIEGVTYSPLDVEMDVQYWFPLHSRRTYFYRPWPTTVYPKCICPKGARCQHLMSRPNPTPHPTLPAKKPLTIGQGRTVAAVSVGRHGRSKPEATANPPHLFSLRTVGERQP